MKIIRATTVTIIQILEIGVEEVKTGLSIVHAI